MGLAFISCDGLMPNGSHEGNLFAAVSQIPNMRLVKRVVPRHVALPLVNNPRGPRVPNNNQDPTKLCGIVEEPVTFHPPPRVRISFKGGHFDIKKR